FRAHTVVETNLSVRPESASLRATVPNRTAGALPLHSRLPRDARSRCSPFSVSAVRLLPRTSVWSIRTRGCNPTLGSDRATLPATLMAVIDDLGMPLTENEQFCRNRSL